jgi:hypothetical protein
MLYGATPNLACTCMHFHIVSKSMPCLEISVLEFVQTSNFVHRDLVATYSNYSGILLNVEPMEYWLEPSAIIVRVWV